MNQANDAGGNYVVADTPKSRMLTHGPGALSDVELLSLLVQSGPKNNAIDVARVALSKFKNLASLVAASGDEIAAVTPGETLALRLPAVMEIARRVLVEQMKARDNLASPAAVRGYLRLLMQHLGHECFWIVFLDAQNRVIEAEEMFRGTLTQTSVYPREVVKAVLRHNAAAVILAHNHPSGVAEPSVQDQALTRTIAETLAYVDVKVLDHFIVAPGACLSFAERGLM
jgi:DNA repair protein RadC